MVRWWVDGGGEVERQWGDGREKGELVGRWGGDGWRGELTARWRGGGGGRDEECISPGDLLDEDWREALGAKLLVNAQEVDLSSVRSQSQKGEIARSIGKIAILAVEIASSLGESAPQQ